MANQPFDLETQEFDEVDAQGRRRRRRLQCVTGTLLVDREGRFGLGTITGVVVDQETGRRTIVSQVVGQRPSLREFDRQRVTVCGRFDRVDGRLVLRVQAIFRVRPEPRPRPAPTPVVIVPSPTVVSPGLQCFTGVLVVDATPRFGLGSNTGVITDLSTGRRVVVIQDVRAVPNIAGLSGQLVAVCGTFTTISGQAVLQIQLLIPGTAAPATIPQPLLQQLLLLLLLQQLGTGLGVGVGTGLRF